MRVNPRVFEQKMDMLGTIQIPTCPSQFKIIAENIVNMVAKPGYTVGDYQTMTELDKRLMVDYWLEYDGLGAVFSNQYQESIVRNGIFNSWFIHQATSAELLRRARQWLTERNYLIVKEYVANQAIELERSLEGLSSSKEN